MLLKKPQWLVGAITAAVMCTASASVVAMETQDWQDVIDDARGQTVYFHAWGGDSRVNRYIDWAARTLERRLDLTLRHVKLDDTTKAVTRVLGEKQAGNDDDGSVDLIWINGENFAAMREHGLLHGPFTESLPNFSLTRPAHNPEVVTDFTLPTNGFEAPWGKAQITFFHDSARVATPPKSIQALLDWVRANPGQFTYPRIPDFTGSTFLKQALIALSNADEALYAPVAESDFDAISAPLWAYLDALHPHLWRRGRSFPDSGPALRTLMGDGELSLAFSFYPSDAVMAVEQFELPPSVRTYVLEGGTLGNVHFVAIPYNSPHKAGAMAVANFLLSPEAQAKKQSLAMWGDRSVLDIQHLPPDAKALFDPTGSHPTALPAAALDQTLAEPHPSWMTALQDAWLDRYGVN